MAITRREFVKQGAIAPAAASAALAPSTGSSQKDAVNPVRVRVGMTDWNLGQRGELVDRLDVGVDSDANLNAPNSMSRRPSSAA
jgi:hypothetical protein